MNQDIFNLSIWMAKVADKYSKSILTVVSEFTKAIEAHKDVELAKIEVVKNFS